MKFVDVHGVKMSSGEEMAFDKYVANNGIAMNTMTKDERSAFVLNWLGRHLELMPKDYCVHCTNCSKCETAKKCLHE